jgi:hypothetical protein
MGRRKLARAITNSARITTTMDANRVSMRRLYIPFLVLSSVLVPGVLQAQSIAITAPAASASISGTAYTITGTMSGTACFVEISVNGDVQNFLGSNGVWLTHIPVQPGQTKWSGRWNTNNRYNSVGASHTMTANLKDCGNTVLATTSNAFQIANNYLEPASYITTSSVVTAGGGTGCSGFSTIAGTCTVTLNFGGTHSGSMQYYGTLEVDGVLASAANGIPNTSTVTYTLNSATFQNGVHEVCAWSRDGNGTSPNPIQFPFTEWCQSVTFSNGTSNLELSIAPKEAVIIPGTTLTLTTLLRQNGSPPTLTAATSPTYSTTASSAICTVGASSGIVSATIGGNGLCPITGTANSISRTVYYYVAPSGLVKHFGADGQLHTTCASPPTDCMWFASGFLNGKGQGFGDYRPQSLFGNAYTQTGYTHYELNPFSPDNTNSASQSCFSSQTAFSSYLTGTGIPYAQALLNPYGLLVHGITTGIISQQLYSSVQGVGNYSPTSCWQTMAQDWANSGIFAGISLADEIGNDYHYPLPSPVVNASGPFTGGSCTVSSTPTCTLNWTPPDYCCSAQGPQALFALTGPGTGAHPALINTPGGALWQATGSDAATYLQFTGTSALSGITFNATTDPGLTVQPFCIEYFSTSCASYTVFSQLRMQVTSASPAPPITAPGPGSADAISQAGWCGPPWADYCEVYWANDNIYQPQHAELNLLADMTQEAITANIRNGFNYWGAGQAFLSQTSGVNGDYGFQPIPASSNIVSIVGPLVTFSADHGLRNVTASTTRITISGSSNAYFNNNFMIDATPTSTTALISRAVPSTSNITDALSGTMTFSDGSTSTTPMTMCLDNAGSSTHCASLEDNFQATNGAGCPAGAPGGDLRKEGLTFTWAGTGNAYFTSNTFLWPNYVVNNGSCAWREVPPISQTSGTATGVIFPNDNYVRGVNYSLGESVVGPRYPHAYAAIAAVLRGAGIRMYFLGADQNYVFQGNPVFSPTGVNINGQVQSSATPNYTNGEMDVTTMFWASAPDNVVLQRLAKGGYLYGSTTTGCTDPGSLLECSLRTNAKGNVQLEYNGSDSTYSRTVDFSACAVSGQSTQKYSWDDRSITVSTIAANTTSENAAFGPGTVIAYLCANNAAAEQAFPMYAFSLADFPGLTAAYVAYGPTAYSVGRNPASVVSCTSGVCTIPWDHNMGPVYVQLYTETSAGWQMGGITPQ